MTKDVDELVLDAFRVEHREQLEQMRTLLGTLHAGDDVARDARVQDAFRLAHSFKGGARVCDLREAEQLGHGLETVLEQLNHGDLPLSESVVATVNTVLDLIEDWMAALEDEKPLPDTSEALAAIDRVLADAAVPAARASNPDAKTMQLRSVFGKEYEQHAARLRELFERRNSGGEAASDDELAEAARAAHTLAGAAAIVDLPSIETAARGLEELFRAARASDRPLDADAQQQIKQALDAMAEAMQEAWVDDQHSSTSASSIGNETSRSAAAIEPGTRETTATPASAACDSVRVSVDSLDRLVRSSNQMLADNQRLSRLTHQVASLQLEVNELDREREALRRSASAKLHKLSAMTEFGRIARYVEYVDRQVSNLAKRTRQLGVEHRRMAWQLRARSNQIQHDVYAARLVPAHSVFQGFRKMVRELAKSEGKQIEFQAAGMDVRADRMVLQDLKDPIMHLLRNCVSHGIERGEQRRDQGKPESGRVTLTLEVDGGRLTVVIEDDGRGFDLTRIQQCAIRAGLLTDAIAAQQTTSEILSALFEPGFSTQDAVTKLAGRGMGLSIVRDAVTRLQGEVRLSPRPESGARVCITVPMFVSTHRVLLVACGNQTIAIPTRGIERLLRIAREKMETMEGQPVVTYQRRPVRLVRLAEVLGQSEAAAGNDDGSTLLIVLLKAGSRLLAISVDALVEERDALIVNLDEFAESSRWAGGILLDDGRAALVVQPGAIIEDALHGNTAFAIEPAAPAKMIAPDKVMIVDDSFTTRTLEKSILEAQGYDVSVAVDGVEALSRMRQEKFALVITDIEMPRMDGFALLERMKADRQLANTPVILVTSRDRQEDQQRGLELGANAYIVKRKFDHQELLSTVRQLM